MIPNQKYRINALAKDFNMKSKDILELLGNHGITGKTHMAVLEPHEFNLIFDELTKSNQISDINDYLSGKIEIPVKEPKIEKQKTEKVENIDTVLIKNNTENNDEKNTLENPEPVKVEPTVVVEKPQQAPTQTPTRTYNDRNNTTNNRPYNNNTNNTNSQNRFNNNKPNNITPTTPTTPITQNTNNQNRFNNRPNNNFNNPQNNNSGNRFNNNQNKPNTNQVPFQFKPNTNKAPIRPIANTNQATQNNDTHRDSSHVSGTRVVDTRTSTVDLSKYDERLETLVPDAAKELSVEKLKLKKQNTRNIYDKERDKERIAMEKLKKFEAEKAKKQQLSITIPDEIIVSDLALRLKVTAAEVVKRLMLLGVMATVNETIDYDTALIVAEELGAKVAHEIVVTIEDRLFDESEDSEQALQFRSPVVVVMGHVDHGKTSLLDAIRNTNVTLGEAGGITQHIGAYRVSINGKEITFLDTPGHEAFTAMRARGAQATDIAILVVAADDGIMPQTIEAINHAKSAGIEIIVAINKMDKPAANPENIKQNLTKYELVPEEWGGDVICVPVSAVTREGIDDLLENVLLIAEMKDFKANPNRRAKGIVIEAKLDKGRGPVATVLVQNGTLNSGDVLIAGSTVGRVRAMTDDKGISVKSAGPSVPVEIIGLAEVPQSGDEFNVVEDERMARELAQQRREKVKEDGFKANAKINLDDLFAQIAEGVQELNIIVKADVGGSVEAVKASLEKLSIAEVKIKIIHTGVGGITEGDVMFASASNAIIVGFNVRPDKGAIDSAERQKVDIRTYRIIYECIEEITAAMKGMLAPKFKEVINGHAEVRQTIHVPSVGTIAGSYVQDGKITRASQIRVIRDGIVIFEDKISSLKRFKDDVKEVAQNYECGIALERFNDIKDLDILEAFIMEEIKQ